MRRFLLVLLFGASCFAATTTPGDPLNRDNPRTAVTSFLEACHNKDYAKASQYLDLSRLSLAARAREGQQLAQDLESLLNADAEFDPVRLSQKPEAPEGGLETIATVKKDDKSYPLQLKLETQKTGPAIWLFAAQTVGILPKLAPLPSTESVIAARLPRFLVANTLRGTPIWIWLVLVFSALIIAGLVRLIAAISLRVLAGPHWHGVHAWLEPALVLVGVACLRVIEEMLVPTALAREDVGEFLVLVAVAAVGWAVINLTEVFLTRLDAVLDPRQRIVSHSLIYLARRTSRVVVLVFGAIFVLDAWGFSMTTILAGLGVGGIAVALAAQQTIANVFGGVSVIGDHPVMVGDFGSFGGVVGQVDDIGLRSTRIRTLSRTVVSIPNSLFAGMNLENYSLRDKILFNPTLSVKRSTPKAQIDAVMHLIGDLLKQDGRVQTVPTTVRITGITAAAFSVEVFCYVRTADADEFYKIASDLYMKIDDQLTKQGVELV